MKRIPLVLALMSLASLASCDALNGEEDVGGLIATHSTSIPVDPGDLSDGLLVSETAVNPTTFLAQLRERMGDIESVDITRMTISIGSSGVEDVAKWSDVWNGEVLVHLVPTGGPPMPIGKAALRRSGGDIAMISYGAYVHHCMRVADQLSAEGIEAAVLDLRSLAPLDKEAILAVTRHCNRVLIVHEDSRTGGIGESLAAIIQEEAFEALDAPVRILGALVQAR